MILNYMSVSSGEWISRVKIKKIYVNILNYY